MGRNLHPRLNSRGEPSTIDINGMACFKTEKRVSATLAPTSCIMLPATRLSGPHLRGRQAPCHPQHALLVSPTTYSHRLCCLPNPSSSQDPIYVGGKHRRVHGDAYFELVDEFLMAVKRRYGTSGESNSGRDRVSASCGGGDTLAVMSLHPLWLTALLPPCPSPAVLIDLAGIDYDAQMKLINQYRGTFPMYSDSAFGLPTAVLAAVYAALPPGAKLADQRFVLVGGAGCGFYTVSVWFQRVDSMGLRCLVLASSGCSVCRSLPAVTFFLALTLANSVLKTFASRFDPRWARRRGCWPSANFPTASPLSHA